MLGIPHPRLVQIGDEEVQQIGYRRHLRHGGAVHRTQLRRTVVQAVELEQAGGLQDPHGAGAIRDDLARGQIAEVRASPFVFWPRMVGPDGEELALRVQVVIRERLRQRRSRESVRADMS